MVLIWILSVNVVYNWVFFISLLWFNLIVLPYWYERSPILPLLIFWKITISKRFLFILGRKCLNIAHKIVNLKVSKEKTSKTRYSTTLNLVFFHSCLPLQMLMDLFEWFIQLFTLSYCGTCLKGDLFTVGILEDYG